MENEFIKKFKQKIQQIDSGVAPAAPVSEIVIERLEDPQEPLYNVHKRSLPVGEDTVAMFNVTKAEFDALKLNRVDKDLMKDLKGQCQTHITKEDTVVYYDLVPVNATAAERSVYYNPKELTREQPEEMALEIVPIAEWID